MGEMIIKYLEEQILPEEKRMRERVYKSENNFLIDENSCLLYHVELVAGGLVKRLLFSFSYLYPKIFVITLYKNIIKELIKV